MRFTSCWYSEIPTDVEYLGVADYKQIIWQTVSITLLVIDDHILGGL